MPINLEIFEGDEYDKNPVKDLRLESAQLGKHRTAGRGEREPEVPDLTDIEVGRLYDHHSTYLQQLAQNGPPLRMAIVFYKQGSASKYMSVTLTNTVITSYSLIGSAGGGEATENFTLNFTKAKYQYHPG